MVKGLKLMGRVKFSKKYSVNTEKYYFPIKNAMEFKFNTEALTGSTLTVYITICSKKYIVTYKFGI